MNMGIDAGSSRYGRAVNMIAVSPDYKDAIFAAYSTVTFSGRSQDYV